MNQVSKLYNQLFFFEKFFRRGAYPIHKKIKHPEYRDIVDWVAHYIEKNTDLDMRALLDVGCGTGYSIQRLRRTFPNLSATGITISTREYEHNCKLVHKGVTFRLQSFDDPIDETYDVILAIEAIKHTENLNKTLSNLSQALNPRGVLILIDDWQVAEWNTTADEKLRLDWSLYRIWKASDLNEAVASSGLSLRKEEDFTAYVSTKPSAFIRVLQYFQRIPIGRIFFAGALLEKAYGAGAFRYQAHVLHRPN